MHHSNYGKITSDFKPENEQTMKMKCFLNCLVCVMLIDGVIFSA